MATDTGPAYLSVCTGLPLSGELGTDAGPGTAALVASWTRSSPRGDGCGRALRVHFAAAACPELPFLSHVKNL